VLSSQEQQVWDDVQRFWAEEAEEPPRPAPSRSYGASRDDADLPAALVAGTWITIMLVLFGALVAGLAVGVATALGWALWHRWSWLTGQGALRTAPTTGDDDSSRRPADEHWDAG
jgi:hypothetical protein